MLHLQSGCQCVGEGAEVFREDCKFLGLEREGSHLCYDSCQANHVVWAMLCA